MKARGTSQDITIKNTGVIVVERGDIKIQSGLKKDSDDSKAFFVLIALDGDIVIETSRDINALLISLKGSFRNKSGYYFSTDQDQCWMTYLKIVCCYSF